MTDNIRAFDLNGVKIRRDPNTFIFRLAIPSGTAANTTFTNASDGAKYQVPALKKATIIFVEQWRIGNNVNARLISSDTVDSDSDPITVWDPAVVNTDVNNVIFISNAIPAARFINFDVNTGLAALELIIFIVEENVA